MSAQRTDVTNAKAKIAAAMISLLAEMKRYDFANSGNAEAVENAFDKLASALRLLNGGIP